jgi:hypothetical protein
MKELTAGLLQMKLSYGLAFSLDSNAKAELKEPVMWKDDNKGEVQVHHSINEYEFMKTKEKLKTT